MDMYSRKEPFNNKIVNPPEPKDQLQFFFVIWNEFYDVFIIDNVPDVKTGYTVFFFSTFLHAVKGAGICTL